MVTEEQLIFSLVMGTDAEELGLGKAKLQFALVKLTNACRCSLFRNNATTPQYIFCSI